MNKREYNKDVARLRRDYIKFRESCASIKDESWTNTTWKWHDAKIEEFKDEVSRLYYADMEFEYANKNSILTLLRINLSIRAIPLHNFGGGIK